MRLARILSSVLLLVVCFIIVYYIGTWLMVSFSWAPFFEPDNYMYYKYAFELLNHLPIINNQLVGLGSLRFFEHSGLFQLPVLLADVLHIPLIWAFRVPMLLLFGSNIFLLYLLINEFYKPLLLPPSIRYWGFAFGFLYPLLLFQSEPIEWRGNLFLSTCLLALALLFYKQYGARGLKFRAIYLLLSVPIILFAYWMWSGWFAILPFFFVMLLFTYTPHFIKTKRHALSVAGFLAFCCLILFVFHNYFVILIDHFTSFFGFPGCGYNPIDIGEIACLTPSNGLTLVISSLLVFLLGYTMVWKYSTNQRLTNFYLYLEIAMCITLLPLALVYVRLVTLIAPFCALAFALGYASMQYSGGRTKSSKALQIIILCVILVGLLYFMYAYFGTSYATYKIDNPPFLPVVGNYLNQQNGTIDLLTFYAYGDWFETYTHAQVYADTIQGLNYSKIELIDNVLLANASSACTELHAFGAKPNYLLVSPMFKGFVVLENATNESVVINPVGLAQCGYNSVLVVGNTTLLRLG